MYIYIYMLICDMRQIAIDNKSELCVYIYVLCQLNQLLHHFGLTKVH